MAWGSSNWGTGYWGTGGGAPTFQTGTTASVSRASDNFRGGAEITIATAGGLLDPAFDTQNLSGWADDSSGGGSTALVTSGRAMRLTASGVPGGVARRVNPIASFQSFDARVTVVPEGPLQLFGSGEIEVASFEVVFSGGCVARCRIVRSGTQASNVFLGVADAGSNCGAILPGATPLTADEVSGGVELQIVRHSCHLRILVGGREIVRDNRYTPPSEDAGFRVQTTGRAASATVSNFNITGHALIGGRLLVNKQVLSPRRMTGVIPAATLFDVGPVVVQVFGLGVRADVPGAFSYTLPTGQTIGRDSGGRVISYTDGQLRDGDE